MPGVLWCCPPSSSVGISVVSWGSPCVHPSGRASWVSQKGICFRAFFDRMKTWMLISWMKESLTHLNVSSMNQASAAVRYSIWTSDMKMRCRWPSCSRSPLSRPSGTNWWLSCKKQFRKSLIDHSSPQCSFWGYRFMYLVRSACCIKHYKASLQ